MTTVTYVVPIKRMRLHIRRMQVAREEIELICPNNYYSSMLLENLGKTIFHLSRLVDEAELKALSESA
jgi:hypothetical protein